MRLLLSYGVDRQRLLHCLELLALATEMLKGMIADIDEAEMVAPVPNADDEVEVAPDPDVDADADV